MALGFVHESDERDKAWWMPNSFGNFTVSSAWDLIRKRRDSIEGILHIWEKGISFLLWRIWLQRIPIGQVLVRNIICDSVVCCCCNTGMQESFNHLFVECPDSYYLWRIFAGAAGITRSFVQLRKSIEKLWVFDGVAKLKPIYKAVLAFIV